MKRKNDLRDIYQSKVHDFEKDFTPQVSVEAIEQRQRDLQRARFTSLFLGGIVLVIALILITVIIRDFLSERTPARTIQTKEAPFIPRHTLSSESTWVMNFSPDNSLDDPESTLKVKPFSAKWVQRAAYHIVMGQQALSMQELEPALEHLNAVVDIYPDIEGVHRSLGMLYLQKEEYAKAAEHLEKALKEKELFDVASNLGSAYIGTEKYDKAETYLKRALELQPENPICHKNLAVLYRKMENEDQAIFHFEKYIDLRPEDLDTLQIYALYLTKLARWKEAATFLTELTESVTDVAPIYFLLAQVQVQNGEEELAMKAMQRGIQLVDPSLALAWMSRDEFDSVRESTEFKQLINELEIAAVSLDD